VFLDDDDRVQCLAVVGSIVDASSIVVHAYALVTTHVHLLLTSATTGSISRATCRLGERYVPAFNRKHGRTGTLWDGRFRSCRVGGDSHLLQVDRHIEPNPVRAAMVTDAEAFPWSSVHANLGTRTDTMVVSHDLFTRFIAGHDGRHAWRAWQRSGIPDHELARARDPLNLERALGSPQFQRMVAGTLNRPAHCRPLGTLRGLANPDDR